MIFRIFVIAGTLFTASQIPAHESNSQNTENSIVEWVMDRQQWQSTTRSCLQQSPNGPDAQILTRYLTMLVANTLAITQTGVPVLEAAEKAVEYCPCGVHDLEYVLTGIYPTGPCILIALTESVWLEHLAQIQRRIQEKIT